MRILKYFFVGVFFGLLIFPKNSEAVPSYAKNMGVDCRVCHTAYPQLNRFGRDFLESASRLLKQTKSGDFSFSTEAISARINMRLLDKSFSKDKTSGLTNKDKQLKERSLHEAELFFAGRTGLVKYFLELEAEDEWPDPAGDAPGFQVQLAKGYAAYDFSSDLNFYAGFASPFVLDGNDTVHHHKVSRRMWSAADQGFVPGTSQMIGVAWRQSNITYTAAVHGNAGDLEGRDPRNFSLRSVYDLDDTKTFGAYYTSESAFNSSSGLSDGVTTKLYGLDTRLAFGGANIMVLYGLKDSGTVNTNFSFEINKPFGAFVPIVNIDSFTSGATKDHFVQYSASLVYQLSPNVRFVPGIEGTLTAPSSFVNKETRFTVAADIGI